MMTQQPLHISGSKVAPDTKIEDSSITNAVKQLKYELATKQTESKRLADQLNCLISLIKRSWTGDKHATIHLSNIVGMVPPEHFDKDDERADLPTSQAGQTSPQPKTELREYQQQYIENRQAYMDAVLQDHQQIMSRIPLHHKSDPAGALEEIDPRVLHYSKVTRRPGSNAGVNSHLVQSAGQRRKVSYNGATEIVEVPLQDFLQDSPATGGTIHSQALNEPHTPAQSAKINRHPLSCTPTRQLPRNTYNDPERYTQENLFTLEESDGIRRHRPVSSTSLKAGDIIRSRPRSGRTFSKIKGDNQINKPAQKHERPLKYETTHPAGSKLKSANRRWNSADGFNRRSASEARPVLLTDVISASSKAAVAIGSGGELSNRTDPLSQSIDDGALHREKSFDEGHNLHREKSFDEGHNLHREKSFDEGHNLHREKSFDEGHNLHHEKSFDEGHNLHHEKSFDEGHNLHAGISAKPPSAVRAKSAFQRRPAFIDEFAEDEQAMRDIQDDFRRTALSLQKKLGIPESGMVI